MKTKIIEIIKSTSADKDKAKEIIALAVIKDEPRHSKADEAGDRLVALRKVVEIIGECDPSEVTISPGLFVLLCAEMENRAKAFAMQEARELFAYQE